MCCDAQSTVFAASACSIVQRNSGLFRLDRVFFICERVRSCRDRSCRMVVERLNVLQGSRARMMGGARREGTGRGRKRKGRERKRREGRK